MKKNNPEEEREIHIENLHQQLEEVTDGKIVSIGFNNCSPELEEQFLEYVLAYEQNNNSDHSDHTQLFDTLSKGGLDLPPPDELNDKQINKKLWDIIHSLALQGVFLYSTDHLSDRELYEVLWHDILREENFTQPTLPNSACHIDILGGWSEEDTILHLTYYADEEERQAWLKDFPEYKLPEPKKKPYNRDALLPKREDWGGGQNNTINY